MKRLTTEDKENIFQFYLSHPDMTLSDICKEFSISRPTLKRILVDHGYHTKIQVQGYFIGDEDNAVEWYYGRCSFYPLPDDIQLTDEELKKLENGKTIHHHKYGKIEEWYPIEGYKTNRGFIRVWSGWAQDM